MTGGPMPATVDQTPAPCARLSLHAFADVAGTGPLDCGGCDGQYDAADAELAASNGVRLAPFRVQLLDSGSDVVYEGLVIPDGPSVWVALPEVCGAWPVRARVAALGGDWAACPSSGGLEREIASGGTHSVSFPLTSGCAGRTATAVVLTPSPVATLIPTDAPDPVGSPSPQTGPGGHATAELDVTPTLTAQTDPTGPPTREPAPSPTASPTESIEVVATPALRFHPSSTPTPTPEVSTPGPPASWLLPSPTATKRLRNPGDPSRGQP
ncbi:MAG: hypothetical protein ACK2T6_04435 [Anaerolineae bacterium]